MVEAGQEVGASGLAGTVHRVYIGVSLRVSVLTISKLDRSSFCLSVCIDADLSATVSASRFSRLADGANNSHDCKSRRIASVAAPAQRTRLTSESGQVAAAAAAAAAERGE